MNRLDANMEQSSPNQNSYNETDLSQFTFLKETLSKKDWTICNLQKTITALQRHLALCQAENFHLKYGHRQRKKTSSNSSLPFELIKMIFFESDAVSRCRMALLNKRIAEELGNWSDVQNVYLSRVPILEKDGKTIVTHSYQVLTNSKSLGFLQIAHAISMLNNFRYLKSLVVESSVTHFLDRCNKIPTEEGFFSMLRFLETLKICSSRDNLSLPYTFAELLALPRLKTLHVREASGILDVPPLNEICAPIEDLRICIPRIRAQHLVSLFSALSKTLQKLEIRAMHIYTQGMPSHVNQLAACLDLVKSMSFIENLTHVTLSRLFLRPSITYEVYLQLRTMVSLKVLTFDIFELADLSKLVNTYLSPMTEKLVVSDTLKIDQQLIRLAIPGSEFRDIFTQERLEQIRHECAKVDRSFILQFGRLRGLGPPSVNIQMYLVTVHGNDIVTPKTDSNDGRVFLWKGRILSRSEYLKLNEILYEPQSSFQPTMY